MSIIETPPKDRLSIQTNVLKFDPAVIQRAIRTELERGGQVYFVHNRVESIFSMGNLDHPAGAGGARRRRPRPDERGRARAGDGRLRRPQVRRAARDDDHRERPRHPEREHDHHQSLRPLRALAALSAARPGRAVRPARLRLPADSAGGFAFAGREEAAGRDPRVQRSRAAGSASPRSTSKSAAPATCSAASRAATSRRSASTCT